MKNKRIIIMCLLLCLVIGLFTGIFALQKGRNQEQQGQQPMTAAAPAGESKTAIDFSEESPEELLLTVEGPLCLVGDAGSTIIRFIAPQGEYHLEVQTKEGLAEVAPSLHKKDDLCAYTAVLTYSDFMYRIKGEGNKVTAWYECGERKEGGTFRFSFLGDPQLVGKTSTAAFAKSLTLFNDSDFALLAGDIVNNHEDISQYEMAVRAISESGVSIASVLGNHDDPELYDFYFGAEHQLQSGNDYAFAYGDALFLCFDSNDYAMGKRREFVEGALGDRDWNWVIACLHHSVFSPINSLDYHAEERRETFTTLFSEYDVDLVLSGDDHFYARTYLMDKERRIKSAKDMTAKKEGQALYVTAGSSSGSKYYEPDEELPDYVAAFGDPSRPSAIQVSVEPNALTIEAVYTETGETFDTFTLAREKAHGSFAAAAEKRNQQRLIREGKYAGDDQLFIEETQIFRSVLPGGPISVYPMREGSNWVNPNFADYAAIALLRCGEEDAVRDYICWHFKRLNAKDYDINGIAYTIFDYDIEMAEGKVTEQKSLMTYDSVDSYAASFLILLAEYFEATKDYALLEEKGDFVKGVIWLLDSIYEDGLTMVRPDYPMYYLMDNCEVMKAYEAADKICDIVLSEIKPDSKSWGKLKENCLPKTQRMKERIAGLWDKEKQVFAYAVSQNGTLSYPEKERYYPDAISQILPVLYGVIDPSSEMAMQSYERFCGRWNWETMEPLQSGSTGSVFSIAAAAAAVMNDTMRLSEFFQSFTRYIRSAEGENCGINETAWVIIAMTGGL